ncbi:MAG: hypothetical protein ACSHX5_08085 [Phycisphaerales bacterium]
MPSEIQSSKDRSPRRSVFSLLALLIPKKRKRQQLSIIRDDDGFALCLNDEQNWSLKWDDVTAVVAYKRDLVTVDQLCFGFRILDDQSKVWCVHEDIPGFKSIIDDITELSQYAWPDRAQEVMLPAFEACWTELWVADGAPPLDEDTETWFLS